MFSIFREKPPLLGAWIDGRELSRIPRDEVPCEKTPSIRLQGGSVLEFRDAEGGTRAYALGSEGGWFHFSVRVHANLACQADCVVSRSERFAPDAFEKGEAWGIRFQPFFLPGAQVDNASLAGQGLFARGLHFSGMVTPGNVVLSCLCDRCARSFLFRSYHAGFSDAGYFYSDSGKYTLVVDSHLAGSPAALSEPDPVELAALEARLPAAPDGSAYKYLNPFRCPHCSAPFIDFERHPGSRAAEYYGNYFVGSALLRYEPTEGPGAAA